MYKEYKYECIAKILFKRLVEIDIQTNKLQEILEQANDFFRIYTEVDSILPLKELTEYFDLETLDKQEKLFNELLEITENEDTTIINKKINKLFEQYIE